MNKKIIIQTFPRIHITLIGMNNDYRKNGGIGFSINTPSINLDFSFSDDIFIEDKRESKYTEFELNKLIKILKDIKNTNKLNNGFSCIITSEVLPHRGLGSSTSIYLSCVEALFLLNDISIEREKIVMLSKRGGTSGIGINTYFDGGFVFDVGIKDENDTFEPSSIADRKGRKPLVLFNGNSPDWDLGICIPSFIKNKSEQEEIDFFSQNCPLNKSFVTDILYESTYGVTSAIIEKDYSRFCESINKIQQTKWKYLERSLYGQDLLDLEEKIKSIGIDCIGMSSLGPLLYFFGNDLNNKIKILINDISDIKIYHAKMNNQGRIITYA